MYLKIILSALGLGIGAYLIGSISFAVLLSKIFVDKDVRDYGSGNAGMTNVMRAIGVLPGILTFVLDFAKGFVAAGVGKIVFQNLSLAFPDAQFATALNGALIGAVACMIGHVFPLFFNFKGGKGVATGCGAFLAVCPITTVFGLGIFAIIFIISRIISISSLSGTLAVVVTSMIFSDLNSGFIGFIQVVLHIIPCALIFIKHKDNILRLVRGEEKKLTVKKGKSK